MEKEDRPAVESCTVNNILSVTIEMEAVTHERYFPVVLFSIMLYKVVNLFFESADEIKKCNSQMKAAEQCFRFQGVVCHAVH